jgi:hypothetical protein
MQEHGLLESWWEIVEKGSLADAGAETDVVVRNYL